MCSVIERIHLLNYVVTCQAFFALDTSSFLYMRRFILDNPKNFLKSGSGKRHFYETSRWHSKMFFKLSYFSLTRSIMSLFIDSIATNQPVLTQHVLRFMPSALWNDGHGCLENDRGPAGASSDGRPDRHLLSSSPHEGRTLLCNTGILWE